MGKKLDMDFEGGKENEGISPSHPPSLPILSYLGRIMSLIDEPVEVRGKDGSVYSGTFYTASVEGLGIALKKAKLIKKGDLKSNVASGALIKTLVICSGHFVEVVCKHKGIILSVYDVSADVHGDDIEAQGIVPSSKSLLSEAKEANKSVWDLMSKIKMRQDEKSIIEVWKNYYGKFLKPMEAQGSNPSSKTFPVEPIGEFTAEKTCHPFHSERSNDATEVTAADTTPDVVGSSALTSSAPVTATSSRMDPPQDSKSYKSSKDMLNPKAKNFSPVPSPSPSSSPSYANPIVAGPPGAPVAANMGYMPGNFPMHIAGSQTIPGTGTFPHPASYGHHGNMGYIYNRGHPAEATPPVFDLNSQAGMHAPMAPYVYMYPMIHGQGAAGFYAMPPPDVQYQAGGQPVQYYIPHNYSYPGQQESPPLASQMPPMQYVPDPPSPAQPMPGPRPDGQRFRRGDGQRGPNPH